MYTLPSKFCDVSGKMTCTTAVATTVLFIDTVLLLCKSDHQVFFSITWCM